MLTKIVKGLNWILSNVVTIETKFVKKGGTYVCIETLKFFNITVDTTEYKIKDVIVDEE